MHIFWAFGAAALSTLIPQTLAAPLPPPLPFTQVHPGGVKDIVITSNNTVNATAPPPAAAVVNATNPTAPVRVNFNATGDATSLNATELSNSTVPNLARAVIPRSSMLQLSFINNFPGAINAYVTGLNSNGQLVMLAPDGTFYYPTANIAQPTPQPITANMAIPLGPLGSTITMTLPDYMSSARIWFASGDLSFFTVPSATGLPSLVQPSSVNPSDPSASTKWGFVEFTYNEDGIFANLSFVDFVGLVLGMSLQVTDGPTQTAEGLSSNAVAAICSALAAQAATDGQPWSLLCQVDANGNPLRVISPSDYISANPSAFSGYFQSYIDSVWAQFTANPLTIDTQSGAGNVACTVQNDLLTCEGDNRGYAKPTESDIFGCNSGPFAIQANDNAIHRAVVPRLCAAFHRSTLTMQGGNIQPGLSSSSYYTSLPTNHYSQHVHANSIDGKGYAFAYDDVNPDGDVNQSGVVADAHPTVLTITIGGPSSSSWR